jgi:hypothetical protein
MAAIRLDSWLLLLSVAPIALTGFSCSRDLDRQHLERTTRATYDQTTGRLRELTYDADKNGKIDTVTFLDGTKVIRTEIDRNEDGRVDRWEYFGADGRLEKSGISRADNGVADAWAYAGSDGTTERLEISLKHNKRIDRWEHYEGGIIARAEEDSTGDGKPDKWEMYQSGTLLSVSLDNDGDGRADRRLTYNGDGQLARIESDPDPDGSFRTQVDIPLGGVR